MPASGQFDVVMVWASDRMARIGETLSGSAGRAESPEHRIRSSASANNIDTAGPLGRAMVVIIGAIAELERNLIVERVRAGMRRAKLEGQRIGRPPLNVDRDALVRDRGRGQSLRQLANLYGISRASVARVLDDAPAVKPCTATAGTDETAGARSATYTTCRPCCMPAV